MIDENRKHPTKSPYTTKQLAPMKALLLEQRARLVADINLMEEEAMRAGEADIDDDSVADHGSDAFERSMTLNLMEKDAALLEQVELALEAMKDRTYGLCEQCGEAIPLGRLEVLPFARTCVQCQSQREQW